MIKWINKYILKYLFVSIHTSINLIINYSVYIMDVNMKMLITDFAAALYSIHLQLVKAKVSFKNTEL